MIKRTLYFGNPAYISFKQEQLVVTVKEPQRELVRQIPIEDIGVVLLDHNQITITHNAIRALQQNKTALISCDEMHMPAALMLPLEGHNTQSQKYQWQVDASVPLKKNLWQQTVTAKVINQGRVLDYFNLSSQRLRILSKRVQSGDPNNIEAQASAYYWKTLFGQEFVRGRYEEEPNHLLNYGYAILRSMTARALVSSGLIPTLGIHHKNKYNAYCLADDIMEPYRPFIDIIVKQLWHEDQGSFLTKEQKKELLSVATLDAFFGKKRRPIMVGMSYTTASIADCFEGKKRKISYPFVPLR